MCYILFIIGILLGAVITTTFYFIDAVKDTFK